MIEALEQRDERLLSPSPRWSRSIDDGARCWTGKGAKGALSNDERKVTMNPNKLSALWEEYRSRVAAGAPFGRRTFLRSGTGAAVSLAGIGSLLELLAAGEAIAAGTVVVPIIGVTREPFRDPDETPHRHTFSAHFRVTDISDTAIVGNVVGRTERVISTGSEEEEQHFHLISMQGVSLEQLLLSGPENNEPGEHMHEVSIE
jgi:hypothetical protein